jgi:cell wall-associated NlpC family hydrolase
MKQINPEDFVNNARSLIPTRWVHEGRSKELGLDCVGLAIVAANMSGGEIDIDLSYAKGDEFSKLIRVLNDKCFRIDCSWKEVKLGDILVFRGSNMRNHIGIYSGNGKFIHSQNGGSRCVIEQEFIGSWRMDLVHVYSFQSR